MKRKFVILLVLLAALTGCDVGDYTSSVDYTDSGTTYEERARELGELLRMIMTSMLRSLSRKSVNCWKIYKTIPRQMNPSY